MLEGKAASNWFGNQRLFCNLRCRGYLIQLNNAMPDNHMTRDMVRPIWNAMFAALAGALLISGNGYVATAGEQLTDIQILKR